MGAGYLLYGDSNNITNKMKLLKQCECCNGEGYIPAMNQDRIEPCPVCDTEGCVDVQPSRQRMLCPLCDGAGEVSTLHPLTWVAFVIGLLFLSVIVAGIVCYKYAIT